MYRWRWAKSGDEQHTAGAAIQVCVSCVYVARQMTLVSIFFRNWMTLDDCGRMTVVTRQATAGFGPELGSSVLNQLSASIYADGSSPPTSPSFSFFSKKIFSCLYINKKELLGCYSATHKYRVHCGSFVGPCLLVRPIYAMFQPNKSMFR